MIYSGKKMLERYCRGAHKNIKRYLNGTANARILKDQKVVSAEGDSLLTTKVRNDLTSAHTPLGRVSPVVRTINSLSKPTTGGAN